jgi:hypothetical protein
METSRLFELAQISVARGSAFGLLAIFCLMVGLAGYPLVALKTGGIALMLGAAVLVVKAEHASRRDPRHTELWTLLDKHERPHGEVAQVLVGSTLRQVFSRYALYYTWAAFGCFAFGSVLELVSALAA